MNAKKERKDFEVWATEQFGKSPQRGGWFRHPDFKDTYLPAHVDFAYQGWKARALAAGVPKAGG